MKPGTGRIHRFTAGNMTRKLRRRITRFYYPRGVDLVSEVHSSRTFFSIPARIYFRLRANFEEKDRLFYLLSSFSDLFFLRLKR